MAVGLQEMSFVETVFFARGKFDDFSQAMLGLRSGQCNAVTCEEKAENLASSVVDFGVEEPARQVISSANYAL